jgi:acyl dehydratase
MKVGDSATKTLLITEELIQNFAIVTGDFNPVHLDEAYASNSFFRARVAHGLIPATLIGSILGTILPGPGSIYLSQTLEFKAPVYLGDRITAEVTVAGISEPNLKIQLDTRVFNQKGNLVLHGVAEVLYRPVG